MNQIKLMMKPGREQSRSDQVTLHEMHDTRTARRTMVTQISSLVSRIDNSDRQNHTIASVMQASMDNE